MTVHRIGKSTEKVEVEVEESINAHKMKKCKHSRCNVSQGMEE
jgi:hypothetical protein